MLAAPKLIVFTDTTRVQKDLMLERFSALAHGAQPKSLLFVLRDYGLSARARWSLGVELGALAVRSEQSFGLADRADLARALGAHALHLPETGIDGHDARRYLGPDVFLSRAWHDPVRAVDPSVDAVVLSPVMGARKGRPALGLPALRRARPRGAESSVAPAIFALGGVDADNAAACLAAGAAGVAVIEAALAVDPAPLLKALRISRP